MDAKSEENNNPAVKTLRFVAYFSPLICGGCAIAIWLDTGTRPDRFGISETNPSGIVLAIFVALAGVLLCALLHVVCDIAETLFVINRTSKAIMEAQSGEKESENLLAPIE